MGRRVSPERKLERKQIAEKFDELIRAQKERRCADQDIIDSRIGIRRFQLTSRPAFVDGVAWDVRQRHDTWRLYRAVIPVRQNALEGFTRMDAESEMLRGYFDELCHLNLRLGPWQAPDLAIEDGCQFDLIVCGDLSSEIRLSWNSICPPGWKGLKKITLRMLKHFGKCPVWGETPLQQP